MRYSIVAAIVALLASSSAQALRGVLPDTSCNQVLEIEAALGSKMRGTAPRESADKYFIIFAGHSHGREALISYKCESSRITVQLITIKLAAEVDGHTAFSDWHRDLSAQFGPPFRDLDEPSVAELEKALEHPTRRLATWLVGERVISLTLLGDSNETWRVMVAGP